jgi:lysophospholipase L1-like esterase
LIGNFYRAGFTAALVLSAAAFAGCASGGGSSVLTPQPTPTPKPVVAYTAIGASDAVGYGASKPCTTATPALGAADPTCLGITGTGYVPVLARRIAAAGATVTLDDLGYSGAVIGPDILAEVNKYGFAGTPTQCLPTENYPTDFITTEVPHVSAASTLVTIFAGGNDTIGTINALGCGAGGITTATQLQFLQTQITAFGHDLATIVADVKTKAPKAKIEIANLPNFALIPVGLAEPTVVQTALAYFSTQIDVQIINPLAGSGIAIVDLLCNPQSYVASNFYTDGFHPDDAGYAVFAQQFYAQYIAATPALPQASCSYTTAQAKLRQPLAQSLRRI